MGEQDRRDKNAEELTFTKRHFINQAACLEFLRSKNVFFIFNLKHEYFHFVPTQVFKTFQMKLNQACMKSVTQ